MNKIINPQYKHLEAQLIDIANGNYTPAHVYCNKRNVVEKVMIDGRPYVVKKFKRPSLINRVAYLVRKSKARRAYEYALQLLENGVSTPVPVAYFETHKCGLYDKACFISEYAPHKLLETVYTDDIPAEKRDEILLAFLNFLSGLHAKGIIPMDLNAGNVFYKEKDGKYEFSLIDINRMKFGATPAEDDSMRSLEQCFYPMEHLYNFVMLYCRKNDVAPYEVMHKVLTLRVKRRARNRFKREMRERRKK